MAGDVRPQHHPAGNVRRLFRLWALYARMDLNWFLQDRAVCVIVMLADLTMAASAISGVALLAARFEGIGGLSVDEILWMLSFYMLGEGLTVVFLGGGNVLPISRRVGRGQVDHMLIQPCPLWVQLIAEGFMPVSGSVGLLAGIALTAVQTARLGIAVTPGWILMLLAYLLARIVVLVGACYALGAAAFYRPVECEELSSIAVDMAAQLGVFPLAALPYWLKAVLTTAVPVGLMAYTPSMALLGRLDRPVEYALPAAVAVAFAALGAALFRKGMRHYAKYSCNRYRDMGHR